MMIRSVTESTLSRTLRNPQLAGISETAAEQVYEPVRCLHDQNRQTGRTSMTDMAGAKAVGMGIVGGAIAAALLDLLVAKGIISADEAQGVLEDAMYRAAMHTGTFEGLEATKLIGDMLTERA
jgi:hypothetical protein